MCLGSGVCGWVKFLVGGQRFLTLWFEVGASNEKSSLWQLLNVASADCSQLKPGTEGIISAASFHGLLIFHMCLLCSSSRWVGPCVLYHFLLGWVRVLGSGEQASMVSVTWELMLFLFIYLFHYFIIYLFILGKKSIYNKT